MATAPRTQRDVFWQCLLLGLLAGVSWLAMAPHPPKQADLGWDKLNHIAAFAALAFTAAQALRNWHRRNWWVGLSLLGFGLLIELVQSQVPGRSADPQDVVADLIGLLLGLASAAAYERLSTVVRAARSGAQRR